MPASFAVSPDGSRIAYEVDGSGPPIVLLHGGGQTRQSWYDLGYAHRLEQDFKVIALDIRGGGESDRPLQASAYSVDKHCQDVIAVVDECAEKDFIMWGFSYGGNIARYLAAQSARVRKLIVMGVPFGPGASGEFRESIIKYREQYLPFVERIDTLSEADQKTLEEHGVPLKLASLRAMLDWPSVSPSDMLCPTLWLVGSKNEGAMASIKDYEKDTKDSLVQVAVIDGLDHQEELTQIDQVFEVMLSFSEA